MDNNNGYVNLRDYQRPQRDTITPGMKRRQEELNSWVSPQELMNMRVVFVEDYYDDRRQHGIIRGPKGTFYFNEKDVPNGLDKIPAKMEHTYGGPQTVTYRGMYINVNDGNSGNIHEGVREFEDDNIAFRVYNYLSQLGKEVELHGNKLYIFRDRLLVDMEVDRFINSYQEHRDMDGREERKNKLKASNEEEFIDDEYIFE